MYVCDLYESELKYYCLRFSNNSIPDFTDQELLGIHLFVGSNQKHFQIKDIHLFAKEYLLSWLPKLPSYQTFNYRLNLMPEVVRNLIDSMPIITYEGEEQVIKQMDKAADDLFYRVFIQLVE